MCDHSHHQHHHHHGVEEKNGSNTSFLETNKAHWDKVAATYNSPETQRKFGDLINKITAFMLQNINWIGVPFLDPSSVFQAQQPQSSTKSIRVLDYACGPGTITAALAGYATEYVGIDISQNMVAEYNKRFSVPSPGPEDGSSQTEKINALAVVGDLLDPSGVPASLEDEKYYSFDLAAVGGGFHHFENVELATQRLTDRLKPGGVLMIWDFLSHAPEDLHDEPALNTIAHHGFDESRVRQLFSGAGLTDIDMKLMDGKVKLRGNAERQGFLARGRKPGA